MFFVGTSVYTLTLNTCVNPAFFLLVFILILPMILFKPKTTTKTNSQRERDFFNVLGFMSMFLPIGVFAKIDVIPIFSAVKPKRPNHIMIPKRNNVWNYAYGQFWILPYSSLLDVISFTEKLSEETKNNGLFLLQCFKKDQNNSWLGYRTYESKKYQLL